MSKSKKFVPVNSYGVDINAMKWLSDDVKAWALTLGMSDVIDNAYNHDKKAIDNVIKGIPVAVDADISAGIVPEAARADEIAARADRINKAVKALKDERDDLKDRFVPDFQASEKLRRTVTLLCDNNAGLADMIGTLKDAFNISDSKARDLVFDLFGTKKAGRKDRTGLSIRHEKDRDGNPVEVREYHAGMYAKSSGTPKTVSEKLLSIGAQSWLNANKNKMLFNYEIFDKLDSLKALKAYLETDKTGENNN